MNTNDFDVAAQILPNEQQRWRDFSSGSEFSSKISDYHHPHGLHVSDINVSNFEPKKEKVSMVNG